MIEKKPCEVCGNENAQIHHKDYNKPLDITWLCKKHHDDFHKKFGHQPASEINLKKLCLECEKSTRVEGSYYCDFCSRLCAKCKNAPKASSSKYCNPCHNEKMREWRKSNPMSYSQRRKDRARSYANVYLRRGKIKKEPCRACGDPNVKMLIPDYSKPLAVLWYCNKHHKQARQWLNEQEISRDAPSCDLPDCIATQGTGH